MPPGSSLPETRRQLTIVVPALNEEAVIRETLTELLEAGRETLERVEIITINDGSTDRTGSIMDELASNAPELVVLHHETPRGVGASFMEALARSSCPYITGVPGDRAYDIASLRRVFRAVGAADLVVTYRTNQRRARSFHRALISHTYTRVLDRLFRLDILDYHSVVVYPVRQLRELPLVSRGYTYALESIVHLLRQDLALAQLPMCLAETRDQRRSQALRWKTFVEVVRTLWRLRHVRSKGRRPGP